MTISILLADDQALLRQGFRMVLSAQNDLVVVGEAADGDEAVQMTRVLEPDVVLMDVRMPRTDGIEATRRIVAETPSTRVIILTTYDMDRYAFSGLHAGASGFLLKDVLPADLVVAIRTVASGDAVVSPRVTRRLLEVFAHRLSDDGEDAAAGAADDLLGSLTSREREVFVEMAAGRTNAEIAVTLTLSDATVKTHVGRILAKLGLRDRVQAVIMAYESGITRPGGRARRR